MDCLRLAGQIELALASLIQAPCRAVVREARTELSPAEFGLLTPEQRQHWGKISAPSRKLEWSEARRCEWEIHAELGPDAKTSLSHTRNGELPMIFAVGARSTSRVGINIGIDVELASRKISASVARHFILPQERALEIDPVHLWVIKEACFKAYPGNSRTAVSQYEVSAYNPGTRNGSARYPGYGQTHDSENEIRFAVLDLDGWVIAVAAFSS